MRIITRNTTYARPKPIEAAASRAKGNLDYSRQAFERALELLDLTLEYSRKRSHLKEVARVREALVDYFFGSNDYGSSGSAWRRYFSQFACAARRNC